MPSSSPSLLFASPVELSADHVDGAEGGNDVGDHLALDHPRKGGHGRQARRTATHAIGSVAAVGDDVKAQLAVGAFRCEVRLAGGWPDAVAVHDKHEVVHQALDGA